MVPTDLNIYKCKSNQVKQWLVIDSCEAQGKGKAKGRPRKVTKRSFIDELDRGEMMCVGSI